ncbi:MAG: HD domain-containing protein [Oscillospiraceae bacterium]|nr:HD domain-containing protein [Oscillospiraceae bacterium]
MDYKSEFLEIFDRCVTRNGKERLLDWLCGTDFFVAPASTRFHGACECGLVMHSLNVYHLLREKCELGGYDYSPETIALVALCHDFCKINLSHEGTRNVKNDETGQWEKVKIYTSEDPFPYGHGEKSVFLIERFVRLTTEEAMAIRWHMGGFDDSARAGNYSIGEAFKRYPLAVMAHLADLEATYLLEKGTSTVNK